VLRGGRVLDLFVRHDSRSAAVSFVSGASEILEFAKKNGLYIRGKRVEASWNDRQFHLPPHVGHKIVNGATRNVVIRGAAAPFLGGTRIGSNTNGNAHRTGSNGSSNSNGSRNGHTTHTNGHGGCGPPHLPNTPITPDLIRADMEHISRLVIVEITVRGADIYVSTNSVHAAMFMKTCMMSRRPYNRFRIDWFADECEGPLPSITAAAPATAPALGTDRASNGAGTKSWATKTTKTSAMAKKGGAREVTKTRNMFEVLALDGEGDGQCGDEDDADESVSGSMLSAPSALSIESGFSGKSN